MCKNRLESIHTSAEISLSYHTVYTRSIGTYFTVELNYRNRLHTSAKFWPVIWGEGIGKTLRGNSQVSFSASLSTCFKTETVSAQFNL